MARLKRFMSAVDKINLFTGHVMVIVLLLAVFVISFEVMMRYLFNMPTNWGHESMTLLFAIMYITLGGFCHYYRGHVRVDILYSALPVRGGQFLMSLLPFSSSFTHFRLCIFVGNFIGARRR